MRAANSGRSVFRDATALLIAAVALACSGAEPAGARPGATGPDVATPAPAAAKPEVTPAAPTPTAETLPPIELDCAVDADCTLGDIDPDDGACCPGCLTTISNTRWKQRAEAFCAAHPASGCPKKRCGEVPPPRCRDGQCTDGP